MEKISEKGIDVPVLAGIMPITNIKQIDRICALSGTKIPREVSAFLEKYRENPAELQKAGLDYAVGQIRGLLSNGVAGVHIYTMNKPFVADAVLKGITR